MLEVADHYWDAGIRHIVALRGDPPEGGGRYPPHPDGYAYAVDLVDGAARRPDFEISVAAYPETHPQASSPEADLDNLKRKIDAGATRAITQFFFDPAVYFRFLERVRAAGITVPVVPGILPVTNFAQVTKFAGMCGAAVPDWLADLFEGLDEDPETRRLVAATVAAEQCRALHAGGVREFHFYTLNRADLDLCHLPCARPAAGKKPTERRVMATVDRQPSKRLLRRAHPRARRRHGHDDPGPPPRRGGVPRQPLRRLVARAQGQQRPAHPDPARRDPRHPRRVSGGRRRHPRDQHLQLDR